MALTEKEELELLQLEEEEYQQSLKKQEPSEPKPRHMEAAMAGLGDVFGFGDEAQAAIESMLPVPEIDKQLLAQGFTGDIGKKPSYSDLVSQYKAKREKLAEESPLAYYGAKGAGMIGTAGIGAGSPILSGIALGALQGAGESEGSIVQDPTQLGKDIATGAGLGFAGGAIGKGLGSLMSRGATATGEAAKESAVRALGFTKKQLKEIKRSAKDFEKIKDLGEYALEKDLTGPFTSPASRLEKLKELKALKEQDLTKALTDIQGEFLTNPELQQQALTLNKIKELAKASTKKPTTKAAEEEAIDKALKTLSDYTDEARMAQPLTPLELQAEKVALNEAGRFAKVDDLTASVEGARALRSQFKKAIEQYSDLISQKKPDAKKIKDINEELSKIAELSKPAEDKALAELVSKPDALNRAALAGSIFTGDPSIVGARAAADIASDVFTGAAPGALKAASKTMEKVAKITPVTTATSSRALQSEFQKNNDTTSLVDMEPQRLQQMAESIASSTDPVDQQLSDLLNIASQKTGVQKNASIFKLMQDPKYRLRLKELNKPESEK